MNAGRPNYGYFVVARRSLLDLLKQGASPLQIATFFVLSRFRHENSCSKSSAGINAVCNRLGIGRKKAFTQLEYLEKIGVIRKVVKQDCHIDESLSSEDNLDFNDLVMCIKESKWPHKKTERIQTLGKNTSRWSLRYGNNVNICSSLVGSGRDKTRLLRDIYKHGETCIKLLLLMIYCSSHDGTIGNKLIWNICSTQNVSTINGIQFWQICFSKNLFFKIQLIRRFIYGNKQIDDITIYQNMIDDINWLISCNYLEKLVVVSCSDENSKNTIQYILDRKTKLPKDSAEQLCNQIDKIALQHGLTSSRKDKRHYNSYWGILKDGMQMDSFMTFRLNLCNKPRQYKQNNVKETVLDWISDCDHSVSQVKQDIYW